MQNDLLGNLGETNWTSKLGHKLKLHIFASPENWQESTMHCPGAEPQHTSQQQSQFQP